MHISSCGQHLVPIGQAKSDCAGGSAIKMLNSSCYVPNMQLVVVICCMING